MYIYEGHLGSLYTSDRYLEDDELYCEQCGDSDWFIGHAETKAQAWDLLKDYTNINGSGGLDYSYVMQFLNENWVGDFTPAIHRHMQFNCPECGAPLEVYYDGTRAGYPEAILIRHCEECGCDWESCWYGEGNESELTRKFWG